MIGMVIEARRKGAYWAVEVRQPHGDTYLARRFAVADYGAIVTLDTLGALMDTGAAPAGDMWCHGCANRVTHEWVVTDGVLRAVCPRGHEYRRVP